MSEFLAFSVDAIKAQPEAGYQSLMPETLRQRLLRITTFIAGNGLVGRMHDGLGRRLALLDMPDADRADPASLDGYLAQRIHTERLDVFNRCFQIAREACAADVADGVLEGEGTERLVGWSNHRINYDILKDGTALAFDLTARETMFAPDDPQFDVLALRAASKQELIPQVAALYGGVWQEIHPRD